MELEPKKEQAMILINRSVSNWDVDPKLIEDNLGVGASWLYMATALAPDQMIPVYLMQQPSEPFCIYGMI